MELGRYYFLFQYDYNIILVDWAVGSSIPYIQAAANAQLVGRQVALLVHALCDIGGAVAGDFHLISHSLGSQVAGYAGARIPGLARITGQLAGHLRKKNFETNTVTPEKITGNIS